MLFCGLVVWGSCTLCLLVNGEVGSYSGKWRGRYFVGL